MPILLPYADSGPLTLRSGGEVCGDAGAFLLEEHQQRGGGHRQRVLDTFAVWTDDPGPLHLATLTPSETP
ncbi:hypothetical protein [Streptomyces sp. NPDC060275]|uniref:hypothetical protein n=1 Tax=Streptomyces sp. NPDC060275 TaxID=3347090 RepID=UPI0036681876